MLSAVGVLLAACAAAGAHLLYTALVAGQRHLLRPGQRLHVRAAVRRMVGRTLVRAGLVGARVRDLVAMGLAAGLLGAFLGVGAFGALLPGLVLGLCVSLWPVAALRARRAEMRAAAQDAWPRILEEVRIRTSSVGRSVPQALFEAGSNAPGPLRPAFDAAHREWLLSTDFERTVAVLKGRLADPTADAAAETLLVAHEVGGTDLDRRLEALIEDRVLDVQGRKDARSRQAGVRFSRTFVLLVPCGMVVAGMSIGTGRAAYATPWGQSMVVLGLLVVALCWFWAGRLLKLPEEERVFAAGGSGPAMVGTGEGA